MPQKITEEQIQESYKLGLLVFESKLSLSDAALKLSESLAMNNGSATGYIYTLDCLLHGKEYRRTINAFATDYYLKSIYVDFGMTALLKAIGAVNKHLEYYEGVGKSKQPKISAIVDSHLDKLHNSLKQQELHEDFESQVITSLNEPRESRITRLKAAKKKPAMILTIAETFCRNPDVVAEVLFRANGICEQCEKPAPFIRRSNNTPYLEVHHIIQLSKGGDDTVDNAMALCPNCHREKHYG